MTNDGTDGEDGEYCSKPRPVDGVPERTGLPIWKFYGYVGINENGVYALAKVVLSVVVAASSSA